MCCSCSTCACCTVFFAALILATMLTAGYLIVKKNQTERFVSRDFKKKFYTLINFVGTYGKVAIIRSKDDPDKEQNKKKLQFGHHMKKPPIRVRPYGQWNVGRPHL